MDRKVPAQELESISDFFISSPEERTTPVAHLSEFTEARSGQRAQECEIEETVSVRKRIAYPDSENAQEDIKKCLFKLLEEDYTICRVELKKSDDIFLPRSRTTKKEEVLIVLKESPF
jgi:hypothetical protein